jgi:hypothetical protein
MDAFREAAYRRPAVVWGPWPAEPARLLLFLWVGSRQTGGHSPGRLAYLVNSVC